MTIFLAEEPIPLKLQLENPVFLDNEKRSSQPSPTWGYNQPITLRSVIKTDCTHTS
jgi:hypothetical protein